MNQKVKHVLGISGGKDSAALAIYMKSRYPELEIEFYTCDTGKELDETYQLIQNLEVYLGLKIKVLKATQNSSEAPFDHFLKMYGGFLPSSNARWCTKKLKLEPFERYVGDDLVVSYVGIRGDEDREGYISTKSNIQSIFPFRKNIWSEDVVRRLFLNSNLEKVFSIAEGISFGDRKGKILELVAKEVDTSFSLKQKLDAFLEADIKGFNHLVFSFLKTTNYPLANEASFPLINNEDVLVQSDIFKLLEESGVGVPAYYNKIDFDLEGVLGQYSRSRSGCYFCFYQQKIEWVWLYEQHPVLFKKAMEYEKDGYTWGQTESLEELIQPERIAQIKEDFLKRQKRLQNKKSPYLLDILGEAEGEGCASCFI